MTQLTPDQLKKGMLVRSSRNAELLIINDVELIPTGKVWKEPNIHYLDMQDPYWGICGRHLGKDETFEQVTIDSENVEKFEQLMFTTRKDLYQRIEHIIEVLRLVDSMYEKQKQQMKDNNVHQPEDSDRKGVDQVP